MTGFLHELTDVERERYQWQMWTADLGESGQQKLKNASVLISRVGGVGGTVALYLAAAGVGRLVLAHHGSIRPGDLNRQLLMTTDGLGTSRVDSARRRLLELNPHVDIVTVNENVSMENADGLIADVDVVVDAAPLFAERMAMNAACMRYGRPMVECAMFDFNAQLTTLIPGVTPCLRCLYPQDPAGWKREFPVFGAVSGVVASMGAVETIKLITQIEEPLTGQMLMMNLRTMEFRRLPLQRMADCPVCQSAPNV